jgi:hypothetical protein
MAKDFILREVVARRLRETPSRWPAELVHVQIMEALSCGHELAFEVRDVPYEPRRRRQCRSCVTSPQT